MEATSYSNHFSALQESKIDFQMFGSLPPNTWVQRYQDKNGNHFQPVAGTYSSICGMQYLSSFVERYNPTVFIKDFLNFSKIITDAVSEIFDHGNNTKATDIKKRHFQALQIVDFDLKSALGDKKTGGLYALLETHKNDSIYSELHTAIQTLKTNIESKASMSQAWFSEDYTESQFSGASEKLSFCPEEAFTDEEWEKAIINSEKFIIESPKIQKYAKYSSTFVCEQTINTINNVALWNEIIQFPNGAKLYLGSIPLTVGAVGYEYRNDLKALKELGVAAVLSATEKFENHSAGFIASPVTSQDWKREGIKQLQIPTPDRTAISLENIQRGVEFIRWNVKSNRNTLVHCKLGKSRSATIVMAYLIKYHSYTADKAYDFVHSKRAEAHFDDDRRDVLRLFEDKCRSSGYR